MHNLTESQKAQRVIRINIQNDIRVAIEAPHSKEALEEATDNIQDKIRHERSKASQSSNIDLVATLVGNGWLDVDYDLGEVLDYLSVEPEEFIEYLEVEDWFDDDEKLEEIRENLIN
jgi:sRNA-binding carbon storage regulator CsrA